MKKIFRYILLSVLGVTVLSACHDFRDDYMVEDTVYLRSGADDLIQDYTVYDDMVRIGVIKAGKGRSTSTVELGIASNDMLFEYNEAHSTEYVALSKSRYNADEIEGKVVTFGLDESRVKVDIKWDPFDMVSLMTTEKDNFVIPIYIKKSNLKINESRDLVLVHPVLSTLSVRETDNPMTCKDGGTFTGKVGVKLDYAIPGHDVKVKLSFTPKAATVNGINYVPAPAGSVTLVSDEAVIKAGDFETDIEVDLDMSGVASDMKTMSGVVKIESAEVVVEGGKNLEFIPITQNEMTVRVTKTAK